ncbi:MAG TPA: hypothetical protein VIX13_02545 [Candidatus Eisenbacteria bacterium]
MALIAGIVTLGAFVAIVMIKAVRPHFDVVLDRRHVSPEAFEAQKPVELSVDESRTLARFASRGLIRPYTVSDLDSLKTVWAAAERRTGKSVSQEAPRTLARWIRTAYDYDLELQNCLLASFDSRRPVTTPRLLALRRKAIDARIVSRELAARDSGLVYVAASGRLTSMRNRVGIPLPRDGMVRAMHRIEQLGRNVDFLDSAFAVTPTKP